MIVRRIHHNSADYHQMISLRQNDLLAPIGVPFSYIQPQKEENDFLIGAFNDGVLIGCCILTPRTAGVVQLRQMVVAQASRGQQIGFHLLRFAESLAIEEGFSLLMMHARNTAIPFYQKSGYAITGDEFFEVGIGHHVMEKKLA